MRHLVGLRNLGAQRIEALLDAAVACREAVAARRSFPDTEGRTVALLFMEPSTRTRVSFEMAVHHLGARPLVLSAATSSAKKGETLLDTARVLRQVGADAVVLRHRQVGAHAAAGDQRIRPARTVHALGRDAGGRDEIDLLHQRPRRMFLAE